MICIIQNDILFDDLALLENRFGIGSLKVTSVNTNCDCDGYASPLTDDDHDTNQIAPFAFAAA